MDKKKVNGIYFERGENYHINDKEEVKVYEYGFINQVKVRNCGKSRNNCLSDYKKINKNEYVNLRTGEIKPYEIGEFKSSASLRKSMKRLRELLRNNFNGGKNEIFLTLTYTEEEKDFDNAVNDLQNFGDKLKDKYENLEYVGIIENQELRDSWHIHMLVKDCSGKELIIPKDKITKLWNKGITYISRIKNKDIKYVINALSINENKKYNSEEEDESSAIKKVINYMSKIESKEKIPNYKKTFYRSKGVKYPKVTITNYGELSKILGDNYYLLSEKTLLIKSVITDKILKRIKEEIYQN